MMERNKRILVLLLALCLCLSAACGAQQVVQDITASNKSEHTAEPLPTAEPAEEQPVQDAAEDSGTDLYLPGQEGFVDDSGTDTPEAADWTALAAEQCVEDLWPEQPGMLPRITLDCPGAAEINARIEEQFVPAADDPMCEGLYYECSKGAGRVLSVLMAQKGPNDTVFYTPFNLDLATGEALSGQELLALLAVDTTQLTNLEQAVIGEEFTHQFGLAEDQTDPDFYREQYDRTTDPGNTETDRVWLGGDGQLYFVGRIYPLAGAECYEYRLGSTLFF